MAISFKKQDIVSKTTLPVTGIRARSSVPAVTIRDNGQVALSSALTKIVLNGKKESKAIVGWKPRTRQLVVAAVGKPPQGMKNEDLFDLKTASGKGGSAALSAAGLFQDENLNVGYDYKNSGTQRFEGDALEVDEKQRAFAVKLPEGSLTPPPKRQRRKKASGEQTPAQAAQAESTGNEGGEGEELTLE